MIHGRRLHLFMKLKKCINIVNKQKWNAWLPKWAVQVKWKTRLWLLEKRKPGDKNV